jgi:hypothetical protein
MSKPTRNTAAGRAYLDIQNAARKQGSGTQELLTLYVVERWLARMSRSPYVEDFILKGGMLLAAYGNRRPTMDADALARNMEDDQETVAQRVASIASLPDPEDGVEFLTETIRTRIIREDSRYAGVRVAMSALLATAKVNVKFDINFGDPITPGPCWIELPSMRSSENTIRILGYPLVTTCAEKIATTIELGPANTRVRDYADLYTLISAHSFPHDQACQALRATADYRGILVEPLTAKLDNFVSLRANAYVAYKEGLGIHGAHLPSTLAEVVEIVCHFADSLSEKPGLNSLWQPDELRWI